MQLATVFSAISLDFSSVTILYVILSYLFIAVKLTKLHAIMKKASYPWLVFPFTNHFFMANAKTTPEPLTLIRTAFINIPPFLFSCFQMIKLMIYIIQLMRLLPIHLPLVYIGHYVYRSLIKPIEYVASELVTKTQSLNYDGITWRPRFSFEAVTSHLNSHGKVVSHTWYLFVFIASWFAKWSELQVSEGA